MKLFFIGRCMALLLCTISSSLVWAGEVAVIVNKNNPYAVDKALVTKIYLGKIGEWPDGAPIEAFDLTEDNPLYDEFYSGLLGKSTKLVRALWAQNIFSGKRLPPKIADGDDMTKQWVRSHNNAIGYIDASSVDDTVKVVLK